MDDLTAAAALLRSTDAGGLLAAALTGGPEPAGFTAALTDWHYRPGAEVTAGYRVGYDTPGGHVVEHLFATTSAVGAPAAVLARGASRFAVWRHPDDPRLPGLAPSCDPATVMGWLGVRPERFDLSLLGYRPLRRAVLRATADADVAYLKVLRPRRADALAERQALFAGAGLTPALLSRPAPGVLVTPAAGGRPLAAHLADPGLGLPGAGDLLALLDRLPPGLVSLPRRAPWAERLDFHAATAVDRLPDAAGRVGALRTRLERVLATAPVGPTVPTHGDLHEANIMVEDGRLSLIDLDAAGPGHREDDLACLLAHLAVLPSLSPGHYAAVPVVLEAWWEAFAAATPEPAALAARVSAVLLSLVAGDAEQAGSRLALAEQWAGRAG